MKGCKREYADNQPRQTRPGKNPQKHVIQTCTHRWEGEERCSPLKSWKYDGPRVQPVFCGAIIFHYLRIIMNRNSKNIIMDGITALQWAREISKLPDGEFILAFYPYSRQRGEASAKLQIRRHCKYRTQLPRERFAIDGENYFLYTDEHGEPKMCYRILIRFMGFPQDGYKLHKINWL